MDDNELHQHQYGCSAEYLKGAVNGIAWMSAEIGITKDQYQELVMEYEEMLMRQQKWQRIIDKKKQEKNVKQ